MLTRDEVKATIGQTLCGVSSDDTTGRRHRCRNGSDAMPAGCIQREVAGTECAAYRQAEAVLKLFAENRALTGALLFGCDPAGP